MGLTANQWVILLEVISTGGLLIGSIVYGHQAWQTEEAKKKATRKVVYREIQ